jgi:sulfite reductase beta subunit-like hemoprotein
MTTANSRFKPNIVIPVLQEEIDHFEGEVKRFQSGDLDAAEFRAFRLRQGVYGQRQPDTQMMRVKIPLGRMTPDQLDVLGAIARDYTPLKRGHITTRENVQYHFMNLDDAATVMRTLGETGLGSREACSNAVRNVTSCPLTGVCPEEIFDPSPYAVAYVRQFVRQEYTHNMPRKWKAAFSGCTHDWVMTAIHDIGFHAVIREENGVEHKGFRIVVGGGTSIQPLIAQQLYDFVPVENFLKVSEACLRVFNNADELRKNKMKARVKVLVNRVGIDEFRNMVEKVMREELADVTYDMDALTAGEYEDPTPPPPKAYPAMPTNDKDFNRWRGSNVTQQKQDGYSAVFIKLRLGNVTDEQFFQLADIARDLAGSIRLTLRQDMVLQWVPNEGLYALYQKLSAVDMVEAGANELSDVVSCPGTESCALGITSSQGMAGNLWDALRDYKADDKLARAIRINVSGCPDGCGHHHMGNIGFQGAATKNGNAQIPSYEVYMGGSQIAPVRIGKRLKVKIPSKRIEEAVHVIVDDYVANRKADEIFNDYVDRIGVEAYESLLAPVSTVPPLDKDSIRYYIDWNRDVLYKVERGEGECAA